MSIHIYTKQYKVSYICYGTIEGYDYSFRTNDIESVQDEMKTILAKMNTSDKPVVWHEIEHIDSKTNMENFLKLVSK